MRSLGLLSQVFTIGLSIAIAFLYIKPTLAEIGTIQTDIAEYKEQRLKIEKINTDLANHVSSMASVKQSDVLRLQTYMPSFVDDVAVLRDIQFIVAETGLIFGDVSYNGLPEPTDSDSEITPIAHEFSLNVEGTYAQIKDLLSLLEQNEYPLEVHDLHIRPQDGTFMSASILLVTYANDTLPLEVE